MWTSFDVIFRKVELEPILKAERMPSFFKGAFREAENSYSNFGSLVFTVILDVCLFLYALRMAAPEVFERKDLTEVPFFGRIATNDQFW